MRFKRQCLCFVLILTLFSIRINDVCCVHITGTFKSREFFKFLVKFGFQKTDKTSDDTTQGFIYGNVTLDNSNLQRLNSSQMMKFLILDANYFSGVYKASPPVQKKIVDRACRRMFKQVGQVAFDARCKPNGAEDFMRSVPCPRNELCEEEDTPERVVSGYQYTFRVQDVQQARFWYISLVSCYLDEQCNWQGSLPTYSNQYPEYHVEDITVQYDIWLVNGNPNSSHLNPFEHQFSFEQHDVAEVYLAFIVIYSVVTCVQVYAYTRLRRNSRRALSQDQQRYRSRSLSQSQADLHENRLTRDREERTSRSKSSSARSAARPRSSSADSLASSRKNTNSTNNSQTSDSALATLGALVCSGIRCVAKLFRRRDVLSVHAACLAVMDFNLALNFVHSLVFAVNGRGIVAFALLANCLQLISESMFIILLGLIARGWYVDRASLPFANRKRFATIVGLYILTNVALESWSFASRAPIEDIDEYQTSAFIAELALRLVATCFFLYSIWRTSRDGALAKADVDVQDFFYQFAAGYLVYFIYLPFLVLICVQYVSALWRFKTIMSVRYAMNFLAYACMVHVTWPSRRPAIFIFQKDYEHTEDEDEVEASWLSLSSDGEPTTSGTRS